MLSYSEIGSDDLESFEALNDMVESRDSEKNSLTIRSRINRYKITNNPLDSLKNIDYSFLDDFCFGADNGQTYFFINNAKEDVGYILLSQHMFQESTLMLGDLYVLPRYRVKGYAKNTVNRSIQYAIDSGYKKIVFPSSESQILNDKFKKYGFDITPNDDFPISKSFD